MPETHVVRHARPLLPPVEFGTFRDPEQALAEAELVAKAFNRRAQGLNLFVQIGESRHLRIEGWQMLAMMYRVTAGIVSTEYVEYGDHNGFEATAEALLIQGAGLPPIRISTAQAMCLNDEERWDVRPEYDWLPDEQQQGKKVKTQVGEVAVPLQQLRSMAQTRAISKVLSNLLKFVAVMAGYAGTPAEEMTQGSAGRAASTQPQRQNGNGLASEKQVGRLWAIAKSRHKSDEAVGVVLESFGYSTKEGIRPAADQIKKSDYDAIVAKVDVP